MYLVNRAGHDIAESVIEAILSRVETLSTMPGIGRKRDDIMIGVRSITEGNYVIYYEISGEELFITRVISGARDSNAYFE